MFYSFRRSAPHKALFHFLQYRSSCQYEKNWRKNLCSLQYYLQFHLTQKNWFWLMCLLSYKHISFIFSFVVINCPITLATHFFFTFTSLFIYILLLFLNFLFTFTSVHFYTTLLSFTFFLIFTFFHLFLFALSYFHFCYISLILLFFFNFSSSW